MFAELKKINLKPEPFSCYTTQLLWDDPHISKQMLAYHLNESVDLASRKKVFIEKSIEWICAQFAVGPQSRICDFGCGPGLYTLGLAARGAHVTGIDFSRNSIHHARQAALKNKLDIDYVLGNYLEYSTGEQFDLVTMIMCDFCALSPSQRHTLLQKVRSILKKDGIFLFDAYSLNSFEKRRESANYEFRLMDGFWSESEYYGFLNIFKYPAENVVLDKYTIIEKSRRWEVFNWLQYFSVDALTRELEESGFNVSEIFADVKGSPYKEGSDEFMVIAKVR
jgi:SAM-dependent methyltransferase